MSLKKNKCYILLLLSLAVITSCKDKLVDAYDGEFEFKVISGNAQSGVFNGLLPDSIVVEVTHPDGTKADGYQILASTEFGELMDDFKTTENGTAAFYWELGCGEDQNVQFWLYGKECDRFSINTGDCIVYDSIVATANAIQEVGWLKGCGIENINEGSIFNAKFEQTEFAQYILLGGEVYFSIDNGLSWKPINGFFFDPVELTEDPSWHILDITKDYSDGSLHGMVSDNTKVRLSEPDQFWISKTSIGEADEDAALGGFVINNNNTFAAFGSDGIFLLENNEWKVVSNALGSGNQIFELGSVSNRVYGVLESNGDKELIFSTNLDYDNWERIELPFSYFRNPFGDFLVLPDETLAIGSGVSCRLSEFFSLNPGAGIVNEYIPNNGINAFGKSIKNLKFYNGEIYFVGFDKNFIGVSGSVYHGKEGDFEELDFDRPCNNILFFDIRNDGSYIIGCDDGIYVFKE